MIHNDIHVLRFYVTVWFGCYLLLLLHNTCADRDGVPYYYYYYGRAMTAVAASSVRATEQIAIDLFANPIQCDAIAGIARCCCAGCGY